MAVLLPRDGFDWTKRGGRAREGGGGGGGKMIKAEALGNSHRVVSERFLSNLSWL